MRTFLPKPIITLTFDDGGKSLYDIAYPVMKGLGLTGAIAVTSDRDGVENYQGVEEFDFMTAEEFKTMHADGWDMLNHGKNHERMSTLSLENQIIAYQTCHDYLVVNGMPEGAKHFVFPTNDYDNSVTENLIAHEPSIVMSGIEGPIEPVGNKIHYNRLDTSNKTTAYIKQLTEEVIASGGVGHYFYHSIGDASLHDWFTYPDAFIEQMQYLAQVRDTGDCRIMNILDYVNTFMSYSYCSINSN